MPQNHVLLESIELSQAASSVTLDNIPQTGYSDLKIVVSARTSDANSISGMGFRVGNGTVDTGSNYTYREITGDGSTPSFSSGTVSSLNSIINGGSSTSNTFGNFEIYIPAYTSSTAKSMSVDTVSENNATSAQARLQAWYWGGTSAINIITFTATSTNFVAGSTFRIYGVAALNTTPVTSPLATGGQIVANDGTYWYHAFLSSGTFVPQKNLSCDVLVVGGGGGGGTSYGGGGGAGGLQQFTSQALSANTGYTATVGAGSAGGGINTNGSPSQFGSLAISYGGGHGGHNGGQNGQNGASGGGGGAGGGLGTGGSAIYGAQGNNGAAAISVHSGGGGGSGTAGAQGGGGVGGAGGRGTTTSISGGSATGLGVLYSGSYYFAAGGAGVYTGGISPTPTFGVIATGSNAPTGTGTGAAENCNGGSGVIIIRYTMV